MIDMDSVGALRLHELPLGLTFVRDIEEFDGPLVSEFRSSTGETFLYAWCDCEEDVNRWVVVRTPHQVIFEYLVGRIPLRKVIYECKDRFVYVVDLGHDASPTSSWYVSIPNLPDEYLPTAESFRRLDSAIEEGFQDVYVGADWGYEDVSAYPRRYLQTYAFHAAFGHGADPSARSPIRYRLTKGWIFNTLYENMRSHIAPSKTAKLEAVSVASPGYLRFSVDQAIATGIRLSLARYMTQRSSIDPAVSMLVRWSTGRVPKTDSKRARKGVTEHKRGGESLTDQRARREVLHICSQLGVNGAALLEQAEDTKRAIRVLSSYRHRLAFLADREEKQEAMLVGLARNADRAVPTAE